MNFYQATRNLIPGNRTSKKLRNNTYVQVRDAETVAIRLHQTDILTFKANGDITLNSGGWRTVTTKARMNEYLPDNWYVSQSKGVWYLSTRPGFEDIGRFEDGMTIQADGTIKGMLPLIPKMDAIDRNLKKRIKKYSVDFVAALERGEVKPSNGDCWHCLMVSVDNGKTLGELTKSDHITDHMKEGYFVFALLNRALETFGASIAMREFVGASIQGEPENVWGVDFIRRDVAKMLYRYICRQYGYAS